MCRQGTGGVEKRGWWPVVASGTQLGPCPYLLGLLQQLHAFPQDLAVKLPALPQDLPAQLLHGGLQVLPLALAQRLAGPPPGLLLQRIVQRGLQLLDFLSGPNHTDSGRSQVGGQEPLGHCSRARPSWGILGREGRHAGAEQSGQRSRGWAWGRGSPFQPCAHGFENTS